MSSYKTLHLFLVCGGLVLNFLILALIFSLSALARPEAVTWLKPRIFF